MGEEEAGGVAQQEHVEDGRKPEAAGDQAKVEPKETSETLQDNDRRNEKPANIMTLSLLVLDATPVEFKHKGGMLLCRIRAQQVKGAGDAPGELPPQQKIEFHVRPELANWIGPGAEFALTCVMTKEPAKKLEPAIRDQRSAVHAQETAVQADINRIDNELASSNKLLKQLQQKVEGSYNGDPNRLPALERDLFDKTKLAIDWMNPRREALIVRLGEVRKLYPLEANGKKT